MTRVEPGSLFKVFANCNDWIIRDKLCRLMDTFTNARFVVRCSENLKKNIFEDKIPIPLIISTKIIVMISFTFH